ncbi:MAG: GLPGLI family protein [Bacteroidia bacterium]|nr:GLPGLI family protein [Bacteroidia bacterium]
MAHLVNIAVAQTIDTVKWRIHYATSFRKTEESKKPRQDERILDIGHTVSRFYSLWEGRYQEVRDSVIKKGGQLQDVMNAYSKILYPRSYSYYIVFKNYPQKGKLTFTDDLIKNYIYQEAMETPQWQMVSGDTLLAGNRCQKAITSFRGRTWTAWFTPEIPISDGPWKLYGLPGLILQATDDKGYFNFKCIQIEKGKNQPIIFQNKKYISCSRKQLNQLYIKKAKDPRGLMKDMGMGESKGWGPDGKPLVYKPKRAILMDE